jgi:hypothetical protein
MCKACGTPSTLTYFASRLHCPVPSSIDRDVLDQKRPVSYFEPSSIDRDVLDQKRPVSYFEPSSIDLDVLDQNWPVSYFERRYGTSSIDRDVLGKFAQQLPFTPTIDLDSFNRTPLSGKLSCSTRSDILDVDEPSHSCS